MQYISTTDLRTKSSELVSELKNGGKVSLIHRSRVVGEIVPRNEVSIKTVNAKNLEAKISKLDFPKLTLREMDRRYRMAMIKKHGKSLS